jgi:hypothetical protein
MHGRNVYTGGCMGVSTYNCINWYMNVNDMKDYLEVQ